MAAPEPALAPTARSREHHLVLSFLRREPRPDVSVGAPLLAAIETSIRAAGIGAS